MSFAQPASSTNKLLIHLLILDENQENEVFTDKFAFDIVSAEANAPNPILNHYLDKAIAAFGKPVELVKARYLNSFWNEQVYANVQEEPVVLGGENGAQYFATYKVTKKAEEEKSLSKSFQTISLDELSFSSSSSSSSDHSSSSSSSSSTSVRSSTSSSCSSIEFGNSQKLLQKLKNTSKPAPIQAKPSILKKPDQSTPKAPIVSTKPEISTLKSSLSKNIVIYLVIDVAQYAGRHFSSMYRYEQSFLFDIEAEKFEKLEKFAKKAVKIWGQKEYDRLDLVSCSKFDAFYKEYLHVEKMLDVKVQNGAKYMINYLLA